MVTLVSLLQVQAANIPNENGHFLGPAQATLIHSPMGAPNSSSVTSQDVMKPATGPSNIVNKQKNSHKVEITRCVEVYPTLQT